MSGTPNEDYLRRKLLQIRISSIEKGLEIVDSVKFIRVKSKKYSIFIMDQHMPIIGEIDGNISYVTNNDEKEIENIKGFFCHRQNIFSLLINEKLL